MHDMASLGGPLLSFPPSSRPFHPNPSLLLRGASTGGTDNFLLHEAAWSSGSGKTGGGNTLLRLRGGSQRDWLPPALAKLPVVTRAFILFNLAFFLLGVAAPDHPLVGGSAAVRNLGFAPGEILGLRSISPAEVVKQAGRVVGHTFTHASLLHVAFNMLSLSSIGASLEVLVGSVSFLFLVATMILATPLTLLAAEAFLYFTNSPPLIPGNMVGFSGVIFALFTLHTLHNPTSVVPIFGHPVPAQYAPLALLGVQSLLFPQASFWGHAAGIAAGFLHARGFLSWTAVPPAWFVAVERSLRHWDGFVRHTGVELAGQAPKRRSAGEGASASPWAAGAGRQGGGGAASGGGGRQGGAASGGANPLRVFRGHAPPPVFSPGGGGGWRDGVGRWCGEMVEKVKG